MFLDKIPKIFFNDWLWIVIAGVFITLHYFFGKPMPPRKPSVFFLAHKKTLKRIYDGFLILLLVFDWAMVFYFSISPFSRQPNDVPPMPISFPLGLFVIMSIQQCGSSAFIIGMLSVFHSNLTRFKRLFLFVISLLPIPLVILSLFINPPEKPDDLRITITAGVYSLLSCWLINGPAIIAGKHFLRVAWYISRALRLTSGDYPDWYE
jgi:hypothetical protein